MEGERESERKRGREEDLELCLAENGGAKKGLASRLRDNTKPTTTLNIRRKRTMRQKRPTSVKRDLLDNNIKHQKEAYRSG